MGAGHYAMVHGRRVRQCYLQARMRARVFFQNRRPCGAPLEQYQAFLSWELDWSIALNDNLERALEQALKLRRTEKCQRRRHKEHRLRRQLRKAAGL